MEYLHSTFLYVFTFLSVYVQMFFLMHFLEKRKQESLAVEPEQPLHEAVTILVPCYNEEQTVSGTIESLLALNYPPELINIIVIDDGSRDKTWEVLQRYKDMPRITLIHQENAGKHEALNTGLRHTTTPFVGCLDADSHVDPEALSRIMMHFYDAQTMAVAPSIVVRNPKNLLQKAQRAEYDISTYNKNILGYIGGIHVTPGPFSIFRKKVFDDLGPYRAAHKTEDQEIALRMQKHHYPIAHCYDAYVYTNVPATPGALIRQRRRWIYGFIKNTIDYRDMIFKKRYGNIAFFTLPAGIISITLVLALFSYSVYTVVSAILHRFMIWQTVGFTTKTALDVSFDPFFFNTNALFLIMILIYTLVVCSFVIGRTMIRDRVEHIYDIILMIIIYSIIAPIWLILASWNALRSHEASWTHERRVRT